MAPPRRDPVPLQPSSSLLASGGGPFQPNSPLRERGVILLVDADRHSYRVATHSGRVLDGIGRLKAHPGDTAILPINTLVRVDYSLGQPYIDAILPEEVPTPPSETASNVTDTSGHGGEDPVLQHNMTSTFRGVGEPRDLLPGDQVSRGPDGALVGALHGKVALLRASPLAQIRAMGNDDIVEVIAGNLRVVTWMGELKILNEDGKTSLMLRGGTDQLTETGADEERYPLRLDIGARGDMVHFVLATPDGAPLCDFKVDAQGKIALLAAGGIDIISGNSPSAVTALRVHGNEERTIEGSLTERVSRDVTEQYSGSRETSVSGNNTTHILQSKTEFTGDAWLAKATGTAQLEGSTVKVKSRSVEIGFLPISHATKYEELNTVVTDLQRQLNSFQLQVKTHTHVVAGTAAGPSPQLIPVQPFTVNLLPAKANNTKID
jgi:hypothetical protein